MWSLLLSTVLATAQEPPSDAFAMGLAGDRNVLVLPAATASLRLPSELDAAGAGQLQV